MRERQSIALVTRHGISTPDARTTTSRRSCRDPRRAIRGLQGAAQGYCRGCADEAAGGCPVPSACRSAQSTGTVGLAGQPALEPGRQRDGGSARCRAGAARSCRRSSGGRVAKRLRPGLMALVNGATRHASDRSKGGCSPFSPARKERGNAVHIPRRNWVEGGEFTTSGGLTGGGPST